MKKILCMAAFFSAFFPDVARAQMIDYASLEALFGEAVTTSATGAPQRVPDAPVPIHIITAEDIQRSGATDLPDVLRGVPGISVWRFTRDDAEVSVRGYNQPFSSRLLVLVNGRQVYMDDYGYAVWSAIPVQLNEIRQIEVVRGPNAALFGFNALAGVVNIVTYNPAYDDVSSLDVTVGTDKYRSASGVHSIKFSDSFSARVSGRLGRADEFKSTNRTNFDDVQQRAVNIDSVYKFGEDSSLRVEMSHAFNDRAEPTPQYSTFFSLYRVNAIKAAYSASTDFGMVTLNAYHNAWNKTLNPLTGTISNGLTVIQAEDVFRIGANHRFRAQAEYRNNTIESDVYFGENAELDSRNMALSGMWDWTIYPSLIWTNAARMERMSFERTGDLLGAPYASNELFDKSFTEYSYNSGLVWSVTERDTLRFMTGRGIQPPALVDFGVYLDVGTINFAGNPEIEPTAMTSYEIGYDRMIEQTGGSAFANVFFQQTQDLKYLGNRNISGTFVGDNIGRSNTYGFELGMDGKVGENWIWDANYMYQDVDDNLHTGEATDYYGEDGTPKHTVNAHIGYAKDKWEADVYANFVSRYDMNTSVASSTDEIGSGSALSLAGRVGYALSDNMILSLSGQELNHQATKQTSILKTERRVFLGLKAEF